MWAAASTFRHTESVEVNLTLLALADGASGVILSIIYFHKWYMKVYGFHYVMRGQWGQEPLLCESFRNNSGVSGKVDLLLLF